MAIPRKKEQRLTRCGPAEGVSATSSRGRPKSKFLSAEAMGRLVGRPELLRFGARPYAGEEPMYLAGRADRLRSLGWAPRFPTLEAGLRNAPSSESLP